MRRYTSRIALLAGLLLGAAQANAEHLLEVYQQALENDPQIRAAEAGYFAAQEATPQSRSALLPQINLSANVAQNSYDISQSATNNGSGDYMSQGYTLSLVQSIYHHDYYAQLKQSDAAVAQAEAQYNSSKQGLILRVAEAYFNLLSAKDSLEVAQAEKRAVEQQLRQTKQRFEVGLSAITDVHEAQAGYDAVVAQEIAAQNSLDNANEALREIIGGAPGELAPLVEEVPLLNPEPADIDAWVQRALENNFELIAVQAQARAAREGLSLAQSGHYPSLDFIASHNYSDTTDWDAGNESTNTTLMLQLNVPIYSGGLTNAKSREARALLTQAEEGLEQQRRVTVRQTRNAFLGVTAGIAQVEARKQALASAQKALEATQAGFEVGTRTALDVLNAQRERFGAQRDYARSRYDYLLATLQLRQAAGSLSEADLSQVNGWLQQ